MTQLDQVLPFFPENTELVNERLRLRVQTIVLQDDKRCTFFDPLDLEKGRFRGSISRVEKAVLAHPIVIDEFG